MQDKTDKIDKTHERRETSTASLTINHRPERLTIFRKGDTHDPKPQWQHTPTIHIAQLWYVQQTYLCPSFLVSQYHMKNLGKEGTEGEI